MNNEVVIIVVLGESFPFELQEAKSCAVSDEKEVPSEQLPPSTRSIR